MYKKLTWTNFEVSGFMVIRIWRDQLDYLQWMDTVDGKVCFGVLGCDYAVSREYEPAYFKTVEEAQVAVDLLQKERPDYRWMVVPRMEAVIVQTERDGYFNSRLVEKSRKLVLPGMDFQHSGGRCPGLDNKEAAWHFV